MGARGTTHACTSRTADRIALAEAIDEGFLRLGISTREFARRIGCNRSPLDKWRTFGITPDSQYFARVMDELGLDPADFGMKLEQDNNS